MCKKVVALLVALITPVALYFCVPSAAAAPAAQASATVAAPISGRPVPTQFDFGLQAGNDASGITGWMPRSGAAWGYAYRYIGNKWASTTTASLSAITYAQAAQARGYLPVFSYYSILAEVGPCTGRTPACGEAETDLSNLNTPATMAHYFADFTILMQRLGTGTFNGIAGYGKDTIVHLEPDLSGYAEGAVLSSAKCYSFCTGVGNDPSLLKASVASSGLPDVAAFPNTYRGFNQALLALRDKYAPNVRLAFHISNWATNYDLNSATSPTLDATALGTKAGQFAAASGVAAIPGSASTYDIVFNDVSNRDAGYYTYVLNKPRFWDTTNTVFPNFRRWEDYIKAATTAAGRPAIVWQVPIGNQYFRTMDNSPGHYQDNRAEYFFAHVNELKSSNVVGVLFGKTIADATNYWDDNGDGTTNPAPICTSDGVYGGQVCNDHVSTVGDDDGGYLRMAGAAYYQAPVSLSS